MVCGNDVLWSVTPSPFRKPSSIHTVPILGGLVHVYEVNAVSPVSFVLVSFSSDLMPMSRHCLHRKPHDRAL